ncbi:MAG TPA: S-methyl-5-thioribose-1-phosphate isomerase [Lacipirellulaceae bacterium]|nr:S-methyl-5-thioribose-1-phosphate isomerase [Lacipirellulaceae bacterium]
MSEPVATIRWSGGDDGFLVLLDQTRLPLESVYLECRTVEQVWQAVKRLSVRGAPAIGVAAAYGVCVGVNEGRDVDEVCNYLATSRPTAVNLFWALERMRRAARRGVLAPGRVGGPPGSPRNELSSRLLAEARAIHEENRRQCSAMGRHGADLLAGLPTGAGLLTHCNAGALAAGGEGMSLAVVFELARRGKRPHVWAGETRPLLQGARLTMWELQQRGIEATLICDSAAAQVMHEGRIRAVITGADRIAANGDTANKIGTFGLAMLARAFGIPFYVVAPVTTFDLKTASGEGIPIEQRAGEEITSGFGVQTAPTGTAVYNPAFDVTPAELITAIITDRGVAQPVNREKVQSVATHFD